MSPLRPLQDWRTWARLLIYLGFWTTWLYLDEWVLPQGFTATSNNLVFFLLLLLAVVLPLVLYLALPPTGPVPHLAEMAVFNILLFFVPFLMFLLPLDCPMCALSPVIFVTFLVIPLAVTGFLISLWLNQRLGRFRPGDK